MQNMHWQRCYDAYLRHLYDKSSSEHTVEAYRSILTHFFAFRHPEDATRADVEYFLRQKLTSAPGYGDPPSAASRNQRLSILSSFYRYASTYMIPGPDGRPRPLFRAASPTLGVTRAKVSRTPRAFTFDELERLFAVIPLDTERGLRDRAIYACLFWCARRKSEIANLLFGDLFHGVVQDSDGTKRDAILYRFRGKGGKVDIAEMPKAAYMAVMRYLSQSGRLATIADDDPLFVGVPVHPAIVHDPYKPIGGDTIWLNLRKYMRLAGLDARRLNVHSLRHGSVRERYIAGEDIISLQHLLRHENISTTNVYLSQLVTPSDPGARLLEERFRNFEW